MRVAFKSGAGLPASSYARRIVCVLLEMRANNWFASVGELSADSAGIVVG